MSRLFSLDVGSAWASTAPDVVSLESCATHRSALRRRLLHVVGYLALIGASAAASAGSPGDPAARARVIATLPDWTGLWETEAAAALDRGTFPPVPKLLDRPPYTPTAEKQYAPDGFPFAGAENVLAVLNRVAPTAKGCEPVGFPGAMESPTVDGLFELLVTPEQTLLLSAGGTVRHIYTDGRAHPKPADLWPTPTGDSVGRWERGTLVVDTIARTAGPIVPLPFPGVANLSEQAHFTEHVRRVGADTLEDRMTIEDPLRLTQPWRITIRYSRVKDLDRMIPGDCEHDRNPLVGGKFVVAPP